MPRDQAGRLGRLGRAEWVDAALKALADGGVAALAVEPVAVRLGTTKGSFYWHFANRAELVTAALAEWEQRYTERVIADLAELPDPVDRLHGLFGRAFRGELTGAIDAALLADAASPLVAPVLERVTRRRLGYLRETYAAMGLPPDRAASRALLAYTTYLGLFSLRRAAPNEVTDAGLVSALEPLLAPPPTP
jgi:AcrR family transcriptional regulator